MPALNAAALSIRQTYLFYDFVYFLIEYYKVLDSHDDPVHRRIYQVRDLLETSFQLL